MGEARHRKPMKWNAFKSKLSPPLHLILQSIRMKGCFASVFGRYDLSICYVFYCNDTINHHACMYAHDQIFVKPERKTGKSNKSCAHVWKKRPWLGRSEATCHQIDPVTRQPVVAGGDMPTGLWHQPVTGRHIKGSKTKLYEPHSRIWNWILGFSKNCLGLAVRNRFNVLKRRPDFDEMILPDPKLYPGPTIQSRSAARRAA